MADMAAVVVARFGSSGYGPGMVYQYINGDAMKMKKLPPSSGGLGLVPCDKGSRTMCAKLK